MAAEAETAMAKRRAESNGAVRVTREDLVALLNEDLGREYRAVISGVVYSRALKGPQYMGLAAKLETHAAKELSHALIIAAQIDYLGGMPMATQEPVPISASTEDMLRFDLEAETEAIRHYRKRVKQCQRLGEYAIAQHIRGILVHKQNHQVALAKGLGVAVPHATRPRPPIDGHSRINGEIRRDV
jgi:bacterioferritin